LLYEFHAALGQYLVYEDAIERRNLDWIMHLAMPEAAYRVLEKEEHILYSLRKREVKLILFDATLKIITEWIN
jgi:XisH protein